MLNKRLNSFILSLFLSKGILKDKEELSKEKEEGELFNNTNNSFYSFLSSSSTPSLLSREGVRKVEVKEKEDFSFTISINSTKSFFNTLLKKIKQLRKLKNLISVRI